MLKVIEFIPGLKDAGAETLVKDYVTLMNKSIITPVVVVLRNHPEAANEQTVIKSGVRIVPIFKNWSIPTRLFKKIFGNIYIPVKLLRIIRKENATVLHVHLQYLKYVKKIANKIHDIKIIYTCHSVIWRYFSGNKNKEKIAADYLVKHNNMQLIAISESIKSDLNNLFNVNNTIYLPNGIDIMRFTNVNNSKDEIRRRLNIPTNAFVLITVGRLIEEKNPMFSIEVFNQLFAQNHLGYMLFIGDGVLRDAIDNKMKEYGLESRYQILSNRSDVPELLRAADLFLFPSKYEGLGIAAIEAQIAGLRCVISDVVPKEAFISEKAIPLSIEAPIDEWIKVICDPSITNTPTGDRESFDMNKVIRRLESIYLS